MPALKDYRHSSDSLTPPSSPAPSPPPQPLSSPKKVPSAASHSKQQALSPDSGSELSELTEDEQDATRPSVSVPNDSTHGESQRVTTKKRNPIVPEPMWNWAYKTPAARKNTDNSNNDDNDHHHPQQQLQPPPGTQPKPSSSNIDSILAAAKVVADDDAARPASPTVAEPPERDGDGDDVEDDDDDGGEEVNNRDSDDDDADTQDGRARSTVPLLKGVTRESSAALSEDDADRDSGWVGSDAESEEEDPAPEEEDEDGGDEDSAVPSENGEDDEDEPTPKNNETASVVPLAPAANSIMAGQQLIKTPSASPSTSPEPEEEIHKSPPKDFPPASASEKTVKIEPVEAIANADNDNDPDPDVDADNDNDNDNDNEDGENADHASAEVELDADAEADADADAELDLQPAHRAEALDVLAGIELKFALLREALYVEKMEELAAEEAMILQGVHPEMTYLQTELQTRHDRRLELAEKKRRCEDNHVILTRKVEENAVWSWWKYERDELQVDMYAEVNRKRRKLEREKQRLERPPPTWRIPPPPPSYAPSKQVTARELVDFVSAISGSKPNSHKRKRLDPLEEYPVKPSLPALSIHEIQDDLQALNATRLRNYHLHADTMGIPPPFEAHYIDYPAPGMNGHPAAGHSAYAQAIPHGASVGSVHPHHPYSSTPPGRGYHPHQQHQQPMGSLFHPRMQGPGAPPPSFIPPPGPGGNRNMHRTPSPPPGMQGYDHGGAIPPFAAAAGASGSGMHWTPIPPPSAANSISSIPGPGAPVKGPLLNGTGKEARRISGGGKDMYDREQRDRDRDRDRDLGRERDARIERDRMPVFYENGVVGRENQDDHGLGGRSQNQGSGGGALQQSQHPHRHTSLHQSLQGVPHHHHIVHHRHATHHHHPPSSSRYPPPPAGGNDLSQGHGHGSRSSISETAPPAGQFWKQEEGEVGPGLVSAREGRHREQGWGPSSVPPPSSGGGAGSASASERQFMMTPSQVVQGRYTPRPGEAPPPSAGTGPGTGGMGMGRRGEHSGWPEDAPPLSSSSSTSMHGHGRSRYDAQENLNMYGSNQNLSQSQNHVAHPTHTHTRQNSNSNGIGSPRPHPHSRNGALSLPQSPPPPVPVPSGPGVAPSYASHHHLPQPHSHSHHPHRDSHSHSHTLSHSHSHNHSHTYSQSQHREQQHPGQQHHLLQQSPTRLTSLSSNHASPRVRASTPKGPGRPVSPLSVPLSLPSSSPMTVGPGVGKHLPPGPGSSTPASASVGFTGPGTPGTIGSVNSVNNGANGTNLNGGSVSVSSTTASRLGTPGVPGTGLSGPGTRPSPDVSSVSTPGNGNTTLNGLSLGGGVGLGHGVQVTHGPGVYPTANPGAGATLSGPAQPNTSTSVPPPPPVSSLGQSQEQADALVSGVGTSTSMTTVTPAPAAVQLGNGA